MQTKIHPIYTDYEFNTDGQYKKINSDVWLNGYNNEGYRLCSMLKDKKHKMFRLHRVLWFVFNGDILDGYEIDHKDGNRNNNKLDNLQSITLNENRKKRNHNFMKNIIKIRTDKNIKCLNLTTNEEKVFKTKYQASKFYGCSTGLIYNICRGKGKTYNKNITFQYTDDKVNTILKKGLVI